MKTLFKQVTYSLSKLIEEIDSGEIGLPDIQRPFVWTNTKVRDLFDSMYKGFPVGYLLFWESSSDNKTRKIGTDDKQQIPRVLIVDGQQRLTSLYAVLKGKEVLGDNYKSHRIHIAFRPRDAKFEVANTAICKDPEFIPDISLLLSGAVKRNRFGRDFVEKLRKHREAKDDELTETQEDHIHDCIDRFYEIPNYPFTVLELSATLDDEMVSDIFVRINSQGKTLKQADFILTLMSVFWDEGRSDLEHFCHNARLPSTNEASPFNYFIKPDPDQLLRVSVGLGFRRARLEYVRSLLRGKDLETKQFSEERRIEQFGIFKQAQAYTLDLQNWHEFIKTLLRAGYRSEDMITSQMALLYSYIMFLIGKRDYAVDDFKLRNVIARWFFMISLTRRYTGSPETIKESDLGRLRTIKNSADFIKTLNRIINDELTEDFWNITLPNELDTSAARSPSLFAYYAALNLLEANVLFSNMKVSELLDPALKAKKKSVERHHLFPKKYLEKIGITNTKEVNQIANFALVEWFDNIRIKDTPPSKYFSKYADRFSASEIEKMCYWHALPEDFEQMDYPTFLSERRKLMAKVIRDGFSKLNT
ncbi:DUF262 domain-containing protein [Candidatus Parabeggiatoa sp. HSG14]|uniref:GmrSD restriction endonuclease domain-containing protein n=1 Tax=Candidatus Parabeggiatoa sp. HSG14 TaxID=3055593 RepID=UPI0025A920FA|nr:DUF262 domain-containing protein [Thiotrichales bacterium HSG14]